MRLKVNLMTQNKVDFTSNSHRYNKHTCTVRFSNAFQTRLLFNHCLCMVPTISVVTYYHTKERSPRLVLPHSIFSNK